MFFPSRFQRSSDDNINDIKEFHGPPSPKGERLNEPKKEMIPVTERSKSSSKPVSIPDLEEQRHSLPPAKFLPLVTPPERLRQSFFNLFRPTLDELNQPGTSDPNGTKRKEEDRTPTPVSMLMLSPEF